MSKGDEKQRNVGELFRELPSWYYAFVLILVALSLVAVSRGGSGQWEITLGIRDGTPLILALALVPILLGFFKDYEEGEAEVANLFSFSFGKRRKEELDSQVDKTEEQLYRAGRLESDPEKAAETRAEADEGLAEALQLGEIPIVRDAYLREFFDLVKDFNRNRRLPFSEERTRQGDRIAFRMRALAPLVFGQFNVAEWLSSTNPGKRLAAIKYLDWSQDIEFVQELVSRILDEKPFIQFHIGLTLHSMVDQLASEHRELIQNRFEDYNPRSGGSRDFWKARILAKLSQS